MQLIPDETVLFDTPGKTLVLTTHRIRHTVNLAGGASLVSIMLEELASCSIIRVTHAVLLILALIAAIVGAFFTMQDHRNDPTGLVVGLVVAVICVILFFTTRQTLLSFASAGATIRVHMFGMKYEAAVDLVDRVEAAKHQRAVLLGSR